MSAVPQPEPGGDAGRVRCLYCGANNFPASSTCWQCSRPLKTIRSMPPEAPGAAPLPHSVPASPGQVRPDGAAPRAFTESALAPKAAAALGMLFPFVGLPAGMIFLMLDDPRKTQLGWILIGWSLAGTIISVITLAVTLGPIWTVLRGMMPHPSGSPSPTPGVPDDSGAGLVLRILALF